MLPKRAELNKILKSNQEKIVEKKEVQRMKDVETKKRKDKADEEKLEKDIKETMKRIEEDILYAIKDAKTSTYRYYGDGHRAEPVWEKAVARLKRHNPDYKFNIQSTSVWCNNHAEAANVDYVSPREWSEPYWKLEISW